MALLIGVAAGLLFVGAARVAVRVIVPAVLGALGSAEVPGKWASAGGVVLDRRGRIAVVRQRNRRGRWRWTLPKGRIDPGETTEAAALREVYEESGLQARIVRPLVRHDGRLHFTYFFEMTLERNDAVYECETKEVRFVTLVEAAKLLRARRDLRVLRQLLEMGTHVVAAPPPDSP
jgi:8-oxo-dGTP pyrophosphatase MutT (NUDIX family)